MLKEEIDQFLAEKRVGVVGVSRNAGKFSNKVYQKLKGCGYDAHPVHPSMESLEGDMCVPSVHQLPSEVRTLMVIASPNVCTKVLSDVSGTCINRIWLFTGKKNQPDIEEEIRRLSDAGVSVISGFCPFMFLEPVDSVHSIHRFFVRLVGKYPK
jgi:predicted CoA-binding protein